jgi:hypothetical protein
MSELPIPFRGSDRGPEMNPSFAGMQYSSHACGVGAGATLDIRVDGLQGGVVPASDDALQDAPKSEGIQPERLAQSCNAAASLLRVGILVSSAERDNLSEASRAQSIHRWNPFPKPLRRAKHSLMDSECQRWGKE